jgi:hypothetical protein
MLEDPELFHKMYITREIKDKESSVAFDIGNYYHTAVLEHEGKIILKIGDLLKAENLIKATKESPVAMELLTGGEPELSCFVELWVCPKSGAIYTEGLDYKLDLFKGWIQNHDEVEIELVDIKIKVRADYINLEEGYVFDLKSTTGNAKDVHKTKNKISSYSYDLSAALYLDIFNAHFLCTEGEDIPEFKTFWWTFASKDMQNCKSYWASEKNIQVVSG